MLRNFLGAVALVTISVSGVHAAGTVGNLERQPSHRLSAKVDDAPSESQIIGAAVHASDAHDADAIGEIHDLLVGNDGEISTTIIRVKSFFGLGERDLAVSYDALRVTPIANGGYHVVLDLGSDDVLEFGIRDVTTADPAQQPAAAPRAGDPSASANVASDASQPADRHQSATVVQEPAHRVIDKVIDADEHSDEAYMGDLVDTILPIVIGLLHLAL